MIGKGFVDLLFILLCGAIVMLAQSVRLGAIPSDPAEADAETESVSGGDVVVMVVGTDWIGIGERRFSSIEEAALAAGTIDVVMVPADRSVAHHRMIEVWDHITDEGRVARFGVVNGGIKGDEA